MGQHEKNEKNDARQPKLEADQGSQGTTNAILRVLDASINRASEGLRVVESFARMVLEDAYLSEQLKRLRHDLTSACTNINAAQRLQARDLSLIHI